MRTHLLEDGPCACIVIGVMVFISRALVVAGKKYIYIYKENIMIRWNFGVR